MADRETMDCDVVIVGAGPAGLATAIRIAQCAQNSKTELSIIVIEKGAEVGAHILSGMIMDISGLDALLPNWRDDKNFPLKTKVIKEQYQILTAQKAWSLPLFTLPNTMDNKGLLLGSLGDLCRWLAAQAESLGVEIYSGFAATEMLYDEQSRVIGICTGDMGVGKNNQPKSNFTPGMNLKARVTILAEGARGSLAEGVIKRFSLRQNCDPQKYGLGIKELWRISPEHHKPGFILHTIGWPLRLSQGGGGFFYHYGESLMAVGLVAHLDYRNPTLSPFDEFQRLKTHPSFYSIFEQGERIEYGARAISEGGWQSVPKLVFPGGCLVGDSAGFVNSARIKGVHNAILSGMLCADHVFTAIKEDNIQTDDKSIEIYDQAWRRSPIQKDLYPVRNFKPLWSRFGLLGFLLVGFDFLIQKLFKLSFLGTFHHKWADHERLKSITTVLSCSYDKPDNRVTFDVSSSLVLSQVFHEEDQPCHLRLKDPAIPVKKNLPIYGEPARLYCPANVYEIIYDNEKTLENPRFIINASNCIHCKTCDIKDPYQNIVWVPPEGGGGPNYRSM